jgi:hypothetical protein
MTWNSKVLQVFILISFIADIFKEFLVGYYEKGEFISGKLIIAKKFMKQSFIFDIIGIIGVLANPVFTNMWEFKLSMYLILIKVFSIKK